LAILEENFDSEKKRDEQILEKLQKLEKKRFESEEKAKLKFNVSFNSLLEKTNNIYF